MSTFGDVRSAVHSGKKEDIRIALSSYDGPWESVSGYIPKDKMPLIWIGSDGEQASAIKAYGDYEKCPLSAYVRLGGHDELIWRCEKPKALVERALILVKRSAIEKHWRPWASKYDHENATKLADELLAMMELWLNNGVSSPYGELARFRNYTWSMVNKSMSNSRVWSTAAWFAAASLTEHTVYACAHSAASADFAAAKTSNANINIDQFKNEINARIDNYLLGTK